MSEVIDNTRQILEEYPLCNSCLGRMFAGKLKVVSHDKLGKKIRKILKQKDPTSCYICKNLMSELGTSLNKIIEISSNYDFSNFLIGAILKPSILDRDDTVRSKFKLRGIMSIKNDVTREMGKRFGRKTRTKVEYHNPDVVFTIDFKKDQYDIKPKALVLQGRYTKNRRGIPQKQQPCKLCQGKGCYACDFHGISEFDSVEGKLAKYFFEKFGGQQVKITWVGSEDVSSLVLGKGRPFFAKLSNPHKRRMILPKKIVLDGISVLNLKAIEKIPSEPVRFKTHVEMEIETENEITPESLNSIKSLSEQLVITNENMYSKNQKRIYSINYKKTSPVTFKVSVMMDGGIPIKRLINGGGSVEPNLSSVMGNQCKCKSFDFHKIVVTN